jgi:hypothetical protein
MQEVSGSIPLTSTKDLPMMQRVGVIAVWVGLIAAVVGLVGGGITLAKQTEPNVGLWLGLIPAGFALMVLGIGITQLHK